MSLRAELVVSEERCNVRWCLFRESGIVEDLRGERASAVVEHELRKVVGNGGGLDAQATEHGIREPPAEELDGIAVCACAEEGGGTAWSEGARRQKVWRDAREALHGGGGVS